MRTKSTKPPAYSSMSKNAPSGRKSTGPLSSATMASFRCPTRQDFFATIRKTKAIKGRAKSFAAGERDVALLEGSLRKGAGEIGGVDENGDEEEEEGLAPHLGETLLDAMDRMETTPELTAINTWLDDLRRRHNFPFKISDVDLSNGVALLDALYIIDASVFEEVEYGEGQVVKPYVERKLDALGAAERNIKVLRGALGRFAWNDPDDGGKPLPGLDFDRVDTWGLAGFVVLAAYVCDRAAEFVDQMIAYEDWVVRSLEDVMWRGLLALGARDRAGRADEESYGGSGVSEGGSSGVSEEEAYWKKRAMEAEKEVRRERKKREDMDRKTRDLEGKAETWRLAHKGMERVVKKLEAEQEEKKGKRRVLKDCNTDGTGATMGRAMSQLRTDNARLRRRVAELEKRSEVHEKEMARVLKDSRRRMKR